MRYQAISWDILCVKIVYRKIHYDDWSFNPNIGYTIADNMDLMWHALGYAWLI